MSSPDAESKTSESAAWNTTSVFLGSEPARVVERPAPRSASIGSTRVAIHAGAMPKATPVNERNAEGEQQHRHGRRRAMGTPAMPATVGNANCRIRRVPANAIARPAAPPRQREQNAFGEGLPHHARRLRPSAMLNDVCRRRSMPRTSMRLATLAQTISSTNPVTIIRI